MNKIVLLNFSRTKQFPKRHYSKSLLLLNCSSVWALEKVQKCSKDLRISYLETYCTIARTFVGLCCSVVFEFVNYCQKYHIFGMICFKVYYLNLTTFKMVHPVKKRYYFPQYNIRGTYLIPITINCIYSIVVPLSPSLEILLRSKKWVPMTVSPTVSLSLNCILIRWHKGGNISVNTSCSFHTGAQEFFLTEVLP